MRAKGEIHRHIAGDATLIRAAIAHLESRRRDLGLRLACVPGARSTPRIHACRKASMP